MNAYWYSTSEDRYFNVLYVGTFLRTVPYLHSFGTQSNVCCCTRKVISYS